MARATKKGAAAPQPEPEAAVAVAPVDTPPAAPVETPATDTADTPPAAVVMDVVAPAGGSVEAGALLVGGIEVTALQPVRWRAGRKFTAAPTVILLADLSEPEVAAIGADPLLSSKPVAVPA